MRFRYCPTCEKDTPHQRALGIGTLLAVILTCGLWLLAIPFYPQRCRVCAAPKYGAIDWPEIWPRRKGSPPKSPQDWTSVEWINAAIGGLAIALILGLFLILMSFLAPASISISRPAPSPPPASQYLREAQEALAAMDLTRAREKLQKITPDQAPEYSQARRLSWTLGFQEYSLKENLPIQIKISGSENEIFHFWDSRFTRPLLLKLLADGKLLQPYKELGFSRLDFTNGIEHWIFQFDEKTGTYRLQFPSKPH